MNIKALITTLFLGSSSVALAHPVSFGADAEVNASLSFDYQAPAPVVRDHRFPVEPVTPAWYMRNHRLAFARPMFVRPAYEPRWIELATLSNSNYNEQILVGADKGAFHTVEVLPSSGKTFVTQVAIGFTDGSYQTVQPKRILEPGREPIRIDLDASYGGRTISRILVAGQSYYGAQYRVIAR